MSWKLLKTAQPEIKQERRSFTLSRNNAPGKRGVFIAGGGQAPLRCERHLWRFSQFSADAAANALPQFSFVVTTSRTALTPARRARQMADPRDG
jgi:hypothetical protein